MALRARDLLLRACCPFLLALILAPADPRLALAEEAPVAAAAKTIPNAKCLGCHDDEEIKNDAGESLAVHEAQFAVSAHRRMDCVECHAAALSSKHPRNALGPVSFDACMDCHEEEIRVFRASVHAQASGDQPKTCVGCHGSVHTAVRSRDPSAPMAALNQVRNCGVCHEGMMEG